MIAAETFPITRQLTTASRLPSVDFDNIPFGRTFSDHMFVAEYSDKQWRNARVVPYGPLPLSPATSALHYGQAIFEGMKAYRMANGGISLFRPEKNIARMAHSSQRMAMPAVPEDFFLAGLMELLRTDQGWVPDREGASLYIRPFLFATDAYVGIRPSDSYLFVIITCPVTSYYTEPLRVKIERHYTRAAAGGIGSAKAAANYGGAIYPSTLAQAQGYHQLLWTDAKHHTHFEESGTMNLFFMIDDVLLTPPVGDTILNGVTRDSVIALAQHWGVAVQQRPVPVDEVLEALRQGRLQDAFGAGTAATIAPLMVIGDGETDHTLPPLDQRPFSPRAKKELDDIRYGRKADLHGWMMPLA